MKSENTKSEVQEVSPHQYQARAVAVEPAIEPTEARTKLVSTSPFHWPINQSLELEFPHPKLNKDGDVIGVVCHVENLNFMLKKYGVTVRYNVITKDQEIVIPDARAQLRDNEKTAKLEVISGICELNKMSTSRLTGQLMTIANNNPFNPVIEYAQSIPWDGKDRIPDVINTVTVDSSIIPWRDAAIENYLKATMCLAINDEKHRFSVKSVLVFQGIQGMGKTPWIRLLMGELGKLLLEGHLLNPENKDSQIAALKHWVVELGELDATTKKSDVAALKAFFTKYIDSLRLPYAPDISSWIRRTAFFGTVNPSSFLVDGTGNDRYWTIPVLNLDLSALERINMQQLWAQVLDKCLDELEAGIMEPWKLTEEQKVMQNAVNDAARLLTPIEESANDILSNGRPWEYHVNSTQIATLCGYPKGKLGAKDKANLKQFLEKEVGPATKYNGVMGWSIPCPSEYTSGDMSAMKIKKRATPNPPPKKYA